ncbi:MAG TPA: hypothetical protein VGR50_00430, partial [Terriglobales bacterium]|nr:hypothetical protein [Terriglobales bacterium]
WLLTLALLPWCICMGATFPLAMGAIRNQKRSFSLLYLANVLGAVLGALLPAFILVELFGFRASLRGTAFLNFFIAALALILSRGASAGTEIFDDPTASADVRRLPISVRAILAVLFLTGFTSMAMEMVWIRKFTPFLGTDIYAFALILATYLAGTFLGSQAYRRWSRDHAFHQAAFVWILLGLSGLIPLAFSDPRVSMTSYLRIALALVPFTGLVGFLTPMLVDSFSGGDPQLAGSAYAVNVLGCIIGPLVSGFWLLPYLGEHWSLVALSAPLFALIWFVRPSGSTASTTARLRWLAGTALVAALLIFLTADFEDLFPDGVVRRDYTATIVATGTGMHKLLFMNGQNLTILTPVTKMMAHLTLASLPRQPQSALVICFGMGTTHRSALSWGIRSTAVELLPSVPSVYGFFHSDGPELLRSPRSQVVIDDGRMFLEKSREQYDVIIIDPPPPIYAAGVSLLYSQDFYELAKDRLAPRGILQQWFYGGDATDLSAMTRAIQQIFPYVEAYGPIGSVGPGTGVHFLASMSPIPERSAAELAARMPASAVEDFLEWGPASSATEQFQLELDQRLAPEKLAALDPQVGPLRDDKPVNEYRYLRSQAPPALRSAMFALAARLR